MYLFLLFLNICDYTLTLVNQGNFVEANPLMALILNNFWLLTVIKLIIVPLSIYILYKHKHKRLVKIITFAITLLYLYAVILGTLIAIQQ